MGGLLFAGRLSLAAEVGETAPDFTIATLDHGEFRLADYRGREPVYLVFWNTWCGYCVRKTPRYKALEEKFGDKIRIIAVNTTWHDSPEEMQSFRDRYAVNYDMAFDEGERLTRQFGVVAVPTEFIIDVDGRIRYRDHVPEFVVAHLPDWHLPYVPTGRPAPTLTCSP